MNVIVCFLHELVVTCEGSIFGSKYVVIELNHDSEKQKISVICVSNTIKGPHDEESKTGETILMINNSILLLVLFVRDCF